MSKQKQLEKDLQKAWQATAQDHFLKILMRKSSPNIKK